MIFTLFKILDFKPYFRINFPPHTAKCPDQCVEEGGVVVHCPKYSSIMVFKGKTFNYLYRFLNNNTNVDNATILTFMSMFGWNSQFWKADAFP